MQEVEFLVYTAEIIGERFKKNLDGNSAALGGAAMLLRGGFSSASVSFISITTHGCN